MMRRASRRPDRALIIVATMFVAELAPAPADAFDPYEVAVLRGLDKVTARVSILEVPVGSRVQFGSLDLTVHTCQKQPPEETPEAAAFLEIVDHRPNGEVVLAFTGWMFASTPGVSAMDHPTYDVWVLDCVNTDSSAERTAGESASE